MNEKYVIGLDFGSDSIRTLLVDAENGREINSAVIYYTRWMEGKYCVPEENQFRHHPLDYLESMETCMLECLKDVDESIRNNILGISVDSTGSTPALVDNDGVILSLRDEFKDNPNGMFILWKDHTSVKETEEINKLAKNWGGEDFTKFEGGVYSSEWWWSKILHVLRTDKEIRDVAYSAIELCDWVPSILTNIQKPSEIKRSRCAAGHKAMWHGSWNGLPSKDFLRELDPQLAKMRDNMYSKTYTSDIPFGTLCKTWAEKLNLSEDIVVGVGAFDAHMGAVGAGIREGSLVKIMGTSTCDVMVIDSNKLGNTLIQGICGQVDGSVLPGMIGLEAGQSSFGDIYAWYKTILSWSINTFIEENEKREEIMESIIPMIAQEAEKIPINDNLIALDWLNGRRTPNANQAVKAAIQGLSLGIDAPRIFRSLAEASAFGAKAINECFEEQGIQINDIIGIGGVAQKSDFVMQVLADVLQRPIKISQSDQTCALGACMFAATVSGIYDNIFEAQKAMEPGFSKRYTPNPQNSKIYSNMYQKYLKLGEFVENA